MVSQKAFDIREDFECLAELSDSKCGVKLGKLTPNETSGEVICDVCDSVATTLRGENPDEIEGGEEADDDEEDFVDEVTVAESDIEKRRSPEESIEHNIRETFDTIRARMLSPETEYDTDANRAFEVWIGERRFEMWRILKTVVMLNHYGRGTTWIQRGGDTIVMFATYIEQYEIPDEFYKSTSLEPKKTKRGASALMDAYTGKKESRITIHIESYGRSLNVKSSTVTAAKEMFVAAEPVYVSGSEEARAVVWLMLTRQKVEGIKFVKSKISKQTGIDARVLSRIEKSYSPYFE